MPSREGNIVDTLVERKYCIVGSDGGIKLEQIWQIVICFTKVLPYKFLHLYKIARDLTLKIAGRDILQTNL